MALTLVSENLAEKKWGFEFGIEGSLNGVKAAEFIGGCSTRTLERLVDAGQIRSAKTGRRVVYCKRSLREYMKAREV